MSGPTTEWCARAVLAVALGLLASDCATKGIDGSTHFVRCQSDSECPSDQVCSADKRCVPRTVTNDAAVDAVGTTSEASAGCPPGVDTSNDPANCGACGNVCAPTVLASGQSGVGAIAVDATSVYWTTGTTTVGACGSIGQPACVVGEGGVPPPHTAAR
jgi:hypothetical protein